MKIKQAILITAYKEPEWVEQIIRCLGSEFYYFLHIDKKSSDSDWIRYSGLAEKYPNIVFISNLYKVNWGGFNHLRAILLLVEKALELEMDYCHLITGQDYPVKSAHYFATEFQNSENYMEYFALPTTNWNGGGLDRLIYYQFHDEFDMKTFLGKKVVKSLKSIQKGLSIKRKLPENFQFYGGSTYWSLNRNCLEYVLQFLKENTGFLDFFRYSFCAEEIFFQSVLLNSPFKNHIINDNRRYICWVTRNGSMPAILDETDYDAIIASTALFARKIAYPESVRLVAQLDTTFLQGETHH